METNRGGNHYEQSTDDDLEQQTGRSSFKEVLDQRETVWFRERKDDEGSS